MPYLIGTDEAGYGPNLGPLVVTATLWHIDESIVLQPKRRKATASEPAEVDLYQLLSRAVCKELSDARPRRVAWADSKILYQPGNIAALERGVLAALGMSAAPPQCWHELWDLVEAGCPRERDELPWHTLFNPPLPLVDHEELDVLLDAVSQCASKAGVRLVRVASRAVSPGMFNRMIDEQGNKASALSHITLQLVQQVVAALDEAGENEPLWIRCDKHGGRNQYCAMLQSFFPDSWVEIRSEGRAESHYCFTLGKRTCTVRFCVESERFAPVAVASMMSKYLRELSMRAFNEFWCGRIEGLRPTAGYPGDARRFKTEIESLQNELGIPDAVLWRTR